MAKSGRRERREGGRARSAGRAARGGDARAAQDARKGSREILAIVALLALGVAAVYAPVLDHEFIHYDDPVYFLQNPHLDGRLGFDDVRSAFAEPYFANWMPVTSLSIAVDNALYGTQPRGVLVTNAALHALASILLFLALLRMTREWLPCAVVAAIFALHPLHVESVAWASQRKDVLAGVFWMATLLAYARYAERPGAARYAAVAVGVALALLSKPTAVTLPLVLLLLDAWPLRRIFEPDTERLSLRPGWTRVLAEKLPLLALAAACSAVTLVVQRYGGAIQEHVPFWERVGNACLAYVDYLRDSVWPSGLAVFYPYPTARLASAQPYLAFAFLMGVTVLCGWLARRRPALLIGWLWWLGALVPMIGLVQAGIQARADRYMYLPQVGLSIAFVFGALDGLRGWRARPAALAACAGLVLALGIAAHAQVRHWRDDATLFEHAIAVTERNFFAHWSLGSRLQARGDADAAERHMREALRIKPDLAEARITLALCLMDRGEFAEARSELARALADGAKPGPVHAALGILAEHVHDPGQAAAEYREALRHDPQHFEATNNLAWLLATTKDPALRDPASALRLAESLRATRSADPLALDTLAAAYAANGRFEEALRAQERALEALVASGDLRQQAEYRARLEAYRAGRPAV